MFIKDKETRDFLRTIKSFMADENDYLLPVNDSKNIDPDKVLLGYYDEQYIYLIPSVVTGMCNRMLHRDRQKRGKDAAQQSGRDVTAARISCGYDRFDMQKILRNLFALNIIKVHWVLSKEVRYRPQKRIGGTKHRYITLIRSEFEKSRLGGLTELLAAIKNVEGSDE